MKGTSLYEYDFVHYFYCLQLLIFEIPIFPLFFQSVKEKKKRNHLGGFGKQNLKTTCQLKRGRDG